MSGWQELDVDTEKQLICAAKKHDTDAQEKILLAHAPLIRALARRFCTSISMLEELMQAGAVGLIRALQRYDIESSTKLITYAVPWIIGEMRSVLRASEQQKTCSLDDERSSEGSYPAQFFGCSGINLSHVDLRIAVNRLERDARLLVYLRYFRDKTQKETAELLGKSQSQVSKLEQRTIDRLRCMLL